MNASQIAQITGLPETKINQYLNSMTAAEIYRDTTYIKALKQLDKDYLNRTLISARKVYENHLQEFTVAIAKRYGINSEPMSPFTLGNWVVGVLEYPDHAGNLLEHHRRIPSEAFTGSMDELLAFLDDMPDGGETWKQALCLLAFPLMKS